MCFRSICAHRARVHTLTNKTHGAGARERERESREKKRYLLKNGIRSLMENICITGVCARLQIAVDVLQHNAVKETRYLRVIKAADVNGRRKQQLITFERALIEWCISNCNRFHFVKFIYYCFYWDRRKDLTKCFQHIIQYFISRFIHFDILFFFQRFFFIFAFQCIFSFHNFFPFSSFFLFIFQLFFYFQRFV